MAQNIPMGLLQTAQQQFSQGTALPTAAATQTDTAGSSSVDVLKGMMARGGAAQKLAQQRNLENQKGLERLFAEAGVGSQGLLNTLGIGLGNALGQRSAGKNPDGAMQNAIAIDNITEQAASSNDPDQLLEFARRLFALGETGAGKDLVALSNQYRNIEKSEAVEQQRKQKEEKQEANIGRPPEVIEIKNNDGKVVSLEMRTWNDLGEEKRTGMRLGDMELLMSSLGQGEGLNNNGSNDLPGTYTGAPNLVDVDKLVEKYRIK